MTSTQIKIQIVNCELQIKNNCNSIKKAEEDYESLMGFKQNVVAYQADFTTGNNGKSQALEAVYDITKDCDTALKYYNGMDKLVNSSGRKIITVFMERLKNSAQNSMREYLNKITELEEKNKSLQRKLERLQKELKIAEMQESLLDANK